MLSVPPDPDPSAPTLGVTVTLMVHEAPGASVPTQVWLCTTNVGALLFSTPKIVAGIVPLLVIVTTFGALVVPMVCGANTRFWKMFGASASV